MQLLQQRLASGSQASSSSRCQPPPSCRPRVAAAPGRARPHNSSRRHPSRVYSAVDAPDEAEELEIDEANDTVFDGVADVNNIYPNYDDPEWVDKVTNWDEFWFTSEDVLDLGDEHDAPGVPGQAGVERAKQLIRHLPGIRGKIDAEQVITPRVRTNEWYPDTFMKEEEYIEEEEMHRIDPNPNYDVIDFRAMAEKRRMKAILDAEWERQQGLLAKPYSYTLRYYCDARLEGSEFDWIRETWSHEQIMNLIVGGGKFVHPEKVQVTVMNPLLPADYHNDYAVQAVPETEEFLEHIGHLATPDEILHLQEREVELGPEDFDRPDLIFADIAAGQRGHSEPPVNIWAEERRARDAADLEVFDAMVSKLQEKQEKREALAEAAAEDPNFDAVAAAAAWDEQEQQAAGEVSSPLDEIMGDGYTRFMTADDDDVEEEEEEGGEDDVVVVYGDGDDDFEYEDDDEDDDEGGEGEEH